MTRRRGLLAAGLTLGAVLAACSPTAENGATVSQPTLVPAPTNVEFGPSAAPFVLPGENRDEAIEAALDAVDERLVEDAALGAEGYRLSVTAGGARSEATTEAGLFYARQSLIQLVARVGEGWAVPAASIVDVPRFAYRGIMLDVARHFFPVETIMACIDRAASLKLNALHLHLSDDQGWRIHIDSWPSLTAAASGTSAGGDTGGFYTKHDYRDIVAYAASRHMIVVPEIDVPSHSHAVSVAYPELSEPLVVSDGIRAQSAALGQDLPVFGEPYEGWAVGFSALKTRDERTYGFLTDVFGELAELTPGPYLHFGGDEALGIAQTDFDAFVARTAQIIIDTGKTPVAWHEAGSAGDLPRGTVGQYWGFTTPRDDHDVHARGFVERGGGLILSPADAVYLDMKYDDGTPLGLAWANGPTSVERSYAWDPVTVIPGVDETAILGVEAPLWTETIASLEEIDTMAFPRLASAAEIAWSPASGPHRTWDSFRARVAGLGPLWTGQGIAFFASPEIPWARE
ncbi:MAG TPA: family 20 glycosylhydrolase [Microbacterium sp.]|uniref:family 20 glycosylhydrolase n=1 Tax=Microbacterium sp. TaxID=51671 RepID=UPI002CADDD11|nr:family 20 glycosylhydrolase [Microbacterium sp.]HWI30168.1 family 20 glycosylhydrolase [Microbacterium sp.]